MRLFQHRILGTIYISLAPEIIWHAPLSHGRKTRLSTASFYARQAPDQGYPEEECGIVSIPRHLFEQYLQPIKAKEAFQTDPHLVRFVLRLRQYPCLPRLHRLMPRGALLHVVHLGASPDGTGLLFDMYREASGACRWAYLNPSLAGLSLSTRQLEGLPRLWVPGIAGMCAATLLLTTLESRMWGTSPVYQGVFSDW